MIVFTRKYPIQRLLKKRFFKQNKLPTLKYGTIGIYCLHTFRFEYRYCLFLRKFFKKMFSFRKRKIATLTRRNTWLFIRPNYVLTHKSKNARMGKGKGNFKRWCTIVYPGRIFIEHINISSFLYTQYLKKLKLKLKVQLKFITNSSNSIKLNTFPIDSKITTHMFQLCKFRKTLYNY